MYSQLYIRKSELKCMNVVIMYKLNIMISKNFTDHYSHIIYIKLSTYSIIKYNNVVNLIMVRLIL